MLVKIINYYLLYFLSVLGGLIGAATLTHFVSPTDYAKLSLILALAAVIQYTVRDNHSILFSKYSDQYEVAKKRLMPVNIFLVVFIFIIAPIVFYFFIDQSFLGLSHSIALWLSLFVMYFSGVVFIAFKARYKHAQHINLFGWLKFIFALGFYVFYESSYISLVLGYMVGALATIVFDRLTFQLPEVEARDASEKMPHTGKIFVAGLLGWGVLHIDRFLIGHYLGEEALSGYFAVIQIGFMPFLLLYTASMNMLIPYLLKGDAPIENHIGKLYTLIIFLALISYWAVQSLFPLLSNLLGEGYREYLFLLPKLSVYAILFSACSALLLSFLTTVQDSNYLKYKSINILGVLIFSMVGIGYGSIEVFLDFIIYFYLIFLTMIAIQIKLNQSR